MTTTPICIISEDAPEMVDYAVEIPIDDLTNNTANIFMWKMDPFKTACIKEIQCQVKVSDNLTSAESLQVQALIVGFVDVFALSVSKVKPVVVMGRGQPGVWWVFGGF